MYRRTSANNRKVQPSTHPTVVGQLPLPRQPIKHVINRILCGPADQILRQLPDESVDCVVTSPPYWALRDYGVKGQVGLESTIQEYIDRLCSVFDEIQRILKKSGTCWINIGDTYYSNVDGGNPAKVNPEVTRQLRSLKNRINSRELPRKSLCQIPSRLALEMPNRGWILRNEIIWHKPNSMPSSVTDRFTMDFEKLFFFVKSRRYFFAQQFEELRNRARLTRPFFKPHSDRKRRYGDKYISAFNPKTAEASRQRILNRGRNKRCVWSVMFGTRVGKVSCVNRRVNQMPNVDLVIEKAKEIAALIEPLGDLEQHAVLQIAETMRAYRQCSQYPTSEPQLPAVESEHSSAQSAS